VLRPASCQRMDGQVLVVLKVRTHASSRLPNGWVGRVSISLVQICKTECVWRRRLWGGAAGRRPGTRCRPISATPHPHATGKKLGRGEDTRTTCVVAVFDAASLHLTDCRVLVMGCWGR
jgi:hypothetical protein